LQIAGLNGNLAGAPRDRRGAYRSHHCVSIVVVLYSSGSSISGAAGHGRALEPGHVDQCSAAIVTDRARNRARPLGMHRHAALAELGHLARAHSQNDGFGILPLALWSVAKRASLLSLHDDLSARDDTLVERGFLRDALGHLRGAATDRADTKTGAIVNVLVVPSSRVYPSGADRTTY
jgi:hypothetical protein